MEIIGFNHFQLDSGDVERTRAFYEAIGGKTIQIMERDGGWRGYHVRLADETTIEIQPPRIPEECGGFDGWDHMALEVEDCAAMVAKIVEAGGRVEKRPTDNTLCGDPIINAVTYGLVGEKIEVIQRQKPAASKEGNGIIKNAHMQLNSTDVERSREFYEKALSGKVLDRIMTKDGRALQGYMLGFGRDSVVEIQPPRFPLTGKKSAWNTIAVETDDINAAIAQIVSAGGIHEVGPMEGSMGTIPIYSAVLIGPDDEHFELIELI